MTHTPTPFTDERGTACLQVPLPGHAGLFVKIEADDHSRIISDLGLSPNWLLNPNGRGTRYVILAAYGCGPTQVARLVMRARPGQRVRYRSADRLDLRRANLFLEAGARTAKHDPEERIAAGAKTRPTRKVPA